MEEKNVVYVVEWKRHNVKNGKVWKVKEVFASQNTAARALIQYRIHEEVARQGGFILEFRMVPYVASRHT